MDDGELIGRRSAQGGSGRGNELNQHIVLSRQGNRLLQIGVALLVFSSLEGFAIPYFASPRLGLSAHTLSALEGVLLLALGLAWLRVLNLSATMSRIAFWLLVYSTVAILAAYMMAALWGARQRDNAPSGRNGSRERLPRKCDQACGVFVCTDGSHLLRTRPLGSSR